MTDAELKVLEKGLKFTPIPEKENTQELKEDLFEFTRKLRLTKYFYGREDPDISLVKNKSDFIPPKNRNAALERYIENVQNTPTTKSNQNIKYNVSLLERNAIKSLANAGPVCQIHRLSDLTDILLRPLTKRVKSYLRDTTDFLYHLPSDVPENTLLATFDVESLYSNIPHELGNEAINYWLRKFPNDSPERFPKNFILEGIDFILKNNTFCFNGKKLPSN